MITKYLFTFITIIQRKFFFKYFFFFFLNFVSNIIVIIKPFFFSIEILCTKLILNLNIQRATKTFLYYSATISHLFFFSLQTHTKNKTKNLKYNYVQFFFLFHFLYFFFANMLIYGKLVFWMYLVNKIPSHIYLNKQNKTCIIIIR